MSTLLVKNADVLVTMNEMRQEIKAGAVLVEGNRISWVGPTVEVERWLAQNRPDLARAGVDQIIDARGCVVLPGLVNCHHHLYQTLTRTIGTGVGKILFDWLKFLYPIWAELRPDDVRISTQLALVELLLRPFPDPVCYWSDQLRGRRNKSEGETRFGKETG